eukprot:scaffold39251_cov77-Cyclotella_meneghiniana.AAC.14
MISAQWVPPHDANYVRWPSTDPLEGCGDLTRRFTIQKNGQQNHTSSALQQREESNRIKIATPLIAAVDDVICVDKRLVR